MVPLEMEEKIKIWSLFNEPYKQSLFFQVGPVLLDSAIIKVPATRVKTIELTDDQIREKEGV